MATSEMLKNGRELFERKSWADAFKLLSKANKEVSLEPEDLERLATAAYLTGKDRECEELWTRAHQQFFAVEHVEQAARSAFWLGMILINKGDRARGAGWISRAQRLVEDREKCVEHGFLFLPFALKSLGEGEPDRAYDVFGKALEIGKLFGNTDLMTLARLGSGQSSIRLKKSVDGIALLDEAMASVEAGLVSPIVAGIVYCAVLETCRETYDLRRAQEWTASMSNWCESQPDLVPFRGQCLVRRAETMQLHGEWTEAMTEAERACELLCAPPGEPAAGTAWYQQAELFRLKGDFSKAEDAYRMASQWGCKPQPGLALLRLVQGDLDKAKAAIQRVEEEEKDRHKRSEILPAYIEIMLAAGEEDLAQESADELNEIAIDLDAHYLIAIASGLNGAILLAKGDVRSALDDLRESWEIWEELETPYESARVRVLIGLACRELGDNDTAMMEFEAARWIFKRLGAMPDLGRVNSLVRVESPGKAHGLTSRQFEVLQLVAEGKSNKAIAEQLFISERTVERHVSDIYSKLNVTSRAAATAYAYKYKLV